MLQVKKFPAVSILKPVHGMEAQLERNIESFFQQDYPCFEILGAADKENDAGLEVVRAVSARYPNIPCRILVIGNPALAEPACLLVLSHDGNRAGMKFW